jgi:hypothetical protein
MKRGLIVFNNLVEYYNITISSEKKTFTTRYLLNNFIYICSFPFNSVISIVTYISYLIEPNVFSTVPKRLQQKCLTLLPPSILCLGRSIKWLDFFKKLYLAHNIIQQTFCFSTIFLSYLSYMIKVQSYLP